MIKRDYRVENLDCAGCAAKIETAANKLDGVDSAVLDFVSKTMTVKYADDKADEAEKELFSVAGGIEDGVVFKRQSDKQEKEKSYKMFSTLTAVGCMGAAIIFSLLHAPDFTAASLLISAVIFGGYDCIYSGIKSLFTLRMNEKLLMTIAIVAAVILGEYFEAAMVAVMFRIGGMLEENALERSRKKIEALAEIQPDTAVLKLDDGSEKEIACADVKIDDTIIIAPHARVPLDGVVTDGDSTLDSSALTGESIPVSAQAGTKVMSGMINGGGTLEVKVSELMEDSAAARIIKSVRESAAKKGESEKFITRFAAVYTPVVVALAAALAFIPPILNMGSFSDYINRALTFLVASCPCALVISVPLGFFSAVGGMTKLGVLVKGGKYIEKLGSLKAIAFDKTGTLTTGELFVTDIYNNTVDSDEEFMKLIASCEYYSTHPIARAVKNKADGDFEKFSDYNEKSGAGVKCKNDGKEYICGSEDFMVQNSVDTDDLPACNVYLACDGELLGGIKLGDRIRENLKENLADMQKAGVEYFAILSGDSASSVMSISQESGISDAYPGLSPNDKVTIVEQIKAKHGCTAFIGDGINDAPVLSGADVGIAMEFGSDSAVETADAVLVSGNLASVSKAVSFAKKSLRTIYGLVVFALAVKAIVLILAVMNLAPMWLAVFADVGVTLLSIAIASSLMFFGNKKMMEIIKKSARYSLTALTAYFTVFRLAAAISQLTAFGSNAAVTVLAVIAGAAAVYVESAWHFTKSFGDKQITAIVISSAAAAPVLKFADKYITGAPYGLICAWGFGCVLSLFAVMIFKSCKEFFSELKKDSPKKSEIFWIAAVWLTTVAVTVFCAAKSNAVYTYDYAIYHERAAFYIDLLKTDPIALCGRIYTSFGTDYSGIPSLLAMPFMLLLGNSRAVYVLSLSVYAFAAYFILFVVTKKVCGSAKKNFVITVLEFPLFVFLIMKGFPDIGCIAVGLTAIYIYMFSQIKEDCGGFFCGIMLACGFLFRRYFMMFAVGFTAVMLIDSLRKKKIRFPFFCALGMSITVFLPFQKMMINTLFARNYADSYSYYQMGAAVNTEYIIKAFGGIMLLFLVLGCVILRKNRAVIFSLTGLIVTLGAFLMTQSPNKHHMVVFMTWMLIIAVYANDFLIKKGRNVFAILLCGAVIQSAVCFIPAEKYPFFHNMLIKPDREPEINVESYKKISDFLTENLGEGEFAYVLGVSDKFSESKLGSVSFSVSGKIASPELLKSAIVDSRDRIPQEFFSARYIAVTDPIQYERGEEYQQIVRVPAEMLLNSEGWARAFRRLENSYVLDDGTVIYIFERIREVTEEEKAPLEKFM